MRKKESSEVEEDGFGDGNILGVPSEIFVVALLFKKNACFQGIRNSVKSNLNNCFEFSESWSLHIFHLAEN